MPKLDLFITKSYNSFIIPFKFIKEIEAAMSKLSYIKEFIVLAETLNYTETAQILFTAQPAVTRHIEILEKELGTPLFQRNTRKVSLTLAGETVYPYFKKVAEEYENAEKAVRELLCKDTGLLTLYSPYYWTEDFTEPVIEKFLQKFPECQIQVISCQPKDCLLHLEQGDGDAAFSIQIPSVLHSFQVVPFAKEPLSVFVHTGNPLSKKASLRLDEISFQPLILFEEYPQFNEYILSLLERSGFVPGEICYAQQIDTLGITIRRTNGVSILPYGARSAFRSYLRVVPLEDENCYLPMCLYYRSDNTNPLLPLLMETIGI